MSLIVPPAALPERLFLHADLPGIYTGKLTVIRAAARAARWCRHNDALARQVVGKGLARWPLRVNAATAVMLAAACSAELVLAGRRFQLFELELQLVQQARLALGARAVEFVPELLDFQIQAGDQRLGVRRHPPGPGRFGFRGVRPRLGLRQGGAQAGDIVGRGGGHGSSLLGIAPPSRRNPP